MSNRKKKITKTSTGSVVFLREGSIHKETAKCHDESSPTFPFFSFFFHKWVTWEIFLKTHTGSIHSVLTKLQHGNVQRTARTTWSCQSSTAAAGQQDSTQGGWRCQCGILFFFFLTIYPVVSLWKPGVPYPVHGRVLVEIQRPRSLHRKAVIQLNTERNQHNQSKQQVSHTVGMKVSHSSQKRKIQDLRRVYWKWDHGGKKLHVSNSSDSQKWQTRLQWCRCLWVWCWSASLTFPPLTADGRSHTRPHPGWRNRAGRSIITWGKSLHLNWTEGTGINLQWPRGAPGPAGRSISDPPPPPAWIGSAPAPPREQR